MRTFSPVSESKTCDNPVCETMVHPAGVLPGVYTRQTNVNYDGYDQPFTYCSNKCVNADYERSSKVAEDASHYWAHAMATVEDQERMTAAHLAAFIEDEERSNLALGFVPFTPAELAARMIDGAQDIETFGADEDETEEVLRDVIVAQVMNWTERGADPTDLAGILEAAANLRVWMAAHPDE